MIDSMFDSLFVLASDSAGSSTALFTFLVYIAAVFCLAVFSNKLLQSKSFLSEYFLGSRSLGVWAFALTFAATSASGGSFTGFPSLIYSHGWILALWIGSYIVYPLCTMGILGKRINQVARISGAITVPDILRDRFRSPMFGLVAVSLIVFFMSFNLVAQFKAGAKILETLLEDVDLFDATVLRVDKFLPDAGLFAGVEPGYFLCLITFAVAVIIYTTYGGFHAVVWTDVMQGIVMVLGVLIMLPLAISQVGGLSHVTTDLAEMIPPRVGFAEISVAAPLNEDGSLTSPWFTMPAEEEVEGEENRPRLFRVNRSMIIPKNASSVADVQFVELVTPQEIDRQLERLKNSETVAKFNQNIKDLAQSQIDSFKKSDQKNSAEHIAAWSELLESVASNEVALLSSDKLNFFTPELTYVQETKFGAGRMGSYVTGPGPSANKLASSAEAAKEKAEKESQSEPHSNPGFLPFSLAISFFFMWALSGTGQPSGMVRLMAFNNTKTLKRSMVTVGFYFTLIYFPLVMIFCCARILLPGMDLESDRIMPQMAVTLTTNVGHGWLAGLLVAAPFAAVMSTVDSFLLMISSALVRDIYQRNINPDVKEKTVKRLSYFFTLFVGAGAAIGAINPPQFLQDIIVFTGAGLAACFLAAVVYALYWPRSNAPGCIAAMLGGSCCHVMMHVIGLFVHGDFYKAYRLFGFDPVVIGLVGSFILGYIVTIITPAPPVDLVKKYFGKQS